jgi:5-formyltetrahydrofolate cyclo-ligase
METWPEIRQWRKEQRERLLQARLDAGADRRHEWSLKIEAMLRAKLSELRPKAIGFCWPFKGEFDARRLIGEMIHAGVVAALPCVVQPKTPLEFRRWTPGAALERGVYDIPVPKEREIVTPDLLLAPLVGFDAAGYRLGYGGGYFDRTFASLAKKPYGLGIGFEMSRLETIYPQPHDIPMDAIITESGLKERR